MEAKDTVKSVPAHSESIWCPHCGEEFGIESEVEYEREAQAEITAPIFFKLGLKEGFILSKVTDPVLLSKTEHKELNRRAKAFLDGVRMEGIKEVVECAERLLLPFVYDGSPKRLEWQIQKKVWGV